MKQSLLDVLVLIVLIAAGCDSQIFISLTQKPDAVERVRILSSINGVNGQDYCAAAGQDQFSIQIPSQMKDAKRKDANGNPILPIHLELLGVDSLGCEIATGELDAEIPTGIRLWSEHFVSITSSSRICPTRRHGACQPECHSSVDCPSERPNCDPQGRCFACNSSSECSRQKGTPICDAGRCIECNTSQDCSDKARPYCDYGIRTCRGCKRHSECDSTTNARDGVCVKDDTLSTLPTGQALQSGMCVTSDRIVSVDTNTCSGACTIQDKLAEVSAQKPYLRIGQFNSTALVTVRPIPGLPEVHIISTQADYSPPDPAALGKMPNAILSNSNGAALRIEGGARATIEGLLIKDSKLGVACVAGGNATKVRILRTLIGLTDVGIQSSPGCELSIEQSWIGEGPRDRYNGLVNNGNILAMDLDGTKFDIVNTVFNNNKPMAPGTFSGIWVRNATATTPGRIVNSTFVRHGYASATRKALMIDCIPAASNLTIVNSLFLDSTPTSGNTYVHADCRSNAQKYLGSDDVSLTGDNNATDLVFSDVFNAPTFGDYSLTTTADSRVRDGGLTQFVDGSGKNIVPTIDIIGTTRTAAKLSRGAFEAAR